VKVSRRVVPLAQTAPMVARSDAVTPGRSVRSPVRNTDWPGAMSKSGRSSRTASPATASASGRAGSGSGSAAMWSSQLRMRKSPTGSPFHWDAMRSRVTSPDSPKASMEAVSTASITVQRSCTPVILRGVPEGRPPPNRSEANIPEAVTSAEDMAVMAMSVANIAEAKRSAVAISAAKRSVVNRSVAGRSSPKTSSSIAPTPRGPLSAISAALSTMSRRPRSTTSDPATRLSYLRSR
jgi:hypothetical protein